MLKDKDSKSGSGEKRDYFRIDDVIPVIANPVEGDKLQYISRSLSASDMPSTHTPQDVPADIADNLNSLKLSELMMEIKIRLIPLKDIAHGQTWGYCVILSLV